MGDNPGYFSVTPAFVRYADISDGAKLLYGEITALCNKEGYCWASNKYFADLYKKNDETISRRIKELIDAKFVTADYEQTQTGKARKLRIVESANHKNVASANHKNVEYNNTSINNTELAKANSNKVDKRNPEVQGLIDSWTESFGNNGGNKARQYANLLVKGRGFERSKGAILAARSVLQEQYAPSITSIQDLYYKWDKLEVFFARRGGEQNKRSVTITE